MVKWVIVALTVLAVSTLAILRRTWQEGDLQEWGHVSERWLAEHRNHWSGDSR
jgi:hypothetical protein